MRPYIVGFHMRPQPSRVNARQVRLVEIKCPMHLAVASLAECSQIPRQEITLVTVQVANCEEFQWRAVLDSAKFATPANASPRPS